MKKKLLFLSLILAAVLSIFAIGAFAETDEPTLKIEAANLEFADSVYLVYAVSHEGVDAENVKMLFFTEPQSGKDGYTLETADYYANLWQEGVTVLGKENCTLFKNATLRAKNMADTVYARAYAEVDGEAYYSEPVKYSILQYAYNKLGKTGTASENEALKTMLEEMLEYGAAAQMYAGYRTDRRADADFCEIKVDGGTLADGFAKGLYLPGESVTLVAPEKLDGKVFRAWQNLAGESVADTATAEITVSAQNETYVAVYGEDILLLDQAAIDEMNGIVAEADAENPFVFPSDAVNALYANGFNMGKFKTYSKDFHYAYDFADNKFYLLNENSEIVYPKETETVVSDLWGFFDNQKSDKIEGVTKYIALSSIGDTNLFNAYDCVFAGETERYTIDLNNKALTVAAKGANKNITLVNGVVLDTVADGYTLDDSVETRKAATAADIAAAEVVDGVMTLDGKIINATTGAGQFKITDFGEATKVVFKNCIFDFSGKNADVVLCGYNVTEYVIENCAINLDGKNFYVIGNENAPDVTIKNCTISSGRGICIGAFVVRNDNSTFGEILIEGNTFIDNATASGKPSLQFSAGASCDAKFTASKITIKDNEFICTDIAIRIHESIREVNCSAIVLSGNKVAEGIVPVVGDGSIASEAIAENWLAKWMTAEEAFLLADKEAVERMNAILAAEGEEFTTLEEVIDVFDAAGFEAIDLTAMSKNMDYYWYAKKGIIVLVETTDEGSSLAFPKDEELEKNFADDFAADKLVLLSSGAKYIDVVVDSVRDLKEAIEAGTQNITLSKDIVIKNDTFTVPENEEIFIDLNGYKLTANYQRPFNMSNGSKLTINAKGATVDCNEYGLINVPASVKSADIVINDGTFNAELDNGAFIKLRSGADNVKITLNNVNYVEKSTNFCYLMNASGFEGKLDLAVNGGSYTGDFGFQVGGNAKATFNGVTFNTNGYGIYTQGQNTKVEVKNCNFIVGTKVDNGGAYASAVSVAFGSQLTINNSKIEYKNGGQYAYVVLPTGGTIYAINNTENSYYIYDSHGSYERGSVYIKDNVVTNAEELREAIEDGWETIEFGNDIAIDNFTITIPENAEIVIDLNGHKLTANYQRPFNMSNGSKLTINAKGATVDCNEYGLINVPASVKSAEIVINDGTFNAELDNGAFIKLRSGANNVKITLNNVNYVEKSTNSCYIINAHGFTGKLDLAVNGGSYTGDFGFQVGGNAKATFDGVSFNTNGYGIYTQGQNTKVEVKNCDFIVGEKIDNGGGYASAVSVTFGSQLTINNSKIEYKNGGQYAYVVLPTGGTINASNNTSDNYYIYDLGSNAVANGVITVNGVKVAVKLLNK